MLFFVSKVKLVTLGANALFARVLNLNPAYKGLPISHFYEKPHWNSFVGFEQKFFKGHFGPNVNKVDG